MATLDLLNFDGDNAETEETSLISADTSDAVAEAVTESNDIDGALVQIEDAVAEATELETQEAVLEAGVESGEGISDDRAAGVEMAVESACRRLRMALPGRLTVLATENFGGRNSRLANTKLALEGLTDTIKTIWQKIIAAIKAVWARVRDFFTRSTNSVDGLEKDAAKVRQALSQFTGKTGGDVTNGSVLAAFSIDGKASLDTVKTVFEGTEEIIGVALKTLDEGDAQADKLTAIIGHARDVKHDQIVDFYDKLEFSKAKGVNKKRGKKGALLVDVLDSKVFYRGQIMRVSITLPKGVDSVVDGNKRGLSEKTSVSAFETAGHLSVEVVGQSKSAASKIKALDVGQMSTVMDLVDKVLEKTRKMNKEISKVEAMQKALTGIGDAAIKYAETKLDNKSENGNVARERVVLSQVRSLTSAMNTLTARLTNGSLAWGMGCAKAGMTLVEASMKSKKND